MADILMPRDVLERAVSEIFNVIEDKNDTPETIAVCRELNDALHNPSLAGYLLPQDALWQADLAIAVLAQLADAIRDGTVIVTAKSGLGDRVRVGMNAANLYTTYRLADTIEAVYHA